MKFKYDCLNNTLWKIDGKYSYEVCENNYFHTFHGIYGTNGFHLGEREWITFAFSQSNFKVHYKKGVNFYQKTLEIPNSGEIFVNFSPEDRVDSS